MARQVRAAITGHGFRDLIAAYVHHQYGEHGLVVYREVNLGKTIIAKDRQIDVFVMRPADQKAIAIEVLVRRDVPRKIDVATSSCA
jgi:PD-(D/E)XK nuclease superfamily protein